MDFMDENNKKQIMEEVDKVCKANPGLDDERVYHILYSQHILRHIAESEGGEVKVEYGLVTQGGNMGFVSVLGKDISFSDMRAFMEVAGMISNFEVYPKTDGTVQINFGFHGVKAKA